MTPYIILMTFGVLISVILLAVWLYFLIKKRQVKHLLKEIGNTSEAQINGDLSRYAKNHKFLFLGPALYKYEVSKLFEVDSILITDKAMLVVEIKSISGVISGEPSAANWTKTVGSQSFPTTNPILQNDKHISHLMKMAAITMPIISLIIYSNRAEYINVKNLPSHVLVAKHTELSEVLSELDRTLPPKISTDEAKRISKSLRSHITHRRDDIKEFLRITGRSK